MESMEPKKLALLRILQIFRQYSDARHPLKQEDIARHLENDYGLVINHNDYVVSYEWFADNVLPTVVVTPR